MSGRAIPILPCSNDLDVMVAFYEAIGFVVTHRQQRPYAHLAINRGGIDLHFGGIDGFEPENSYGSAILLVPDTGTLFDEFATGLRATYGKLPIEGIPRITRPRRKQGMAAGFSVVDPAGNWLRVTSGAETDDAPAGALDRILLNATRQGDSHGDTARAIAIIDAGLARHPDASSSDLVPVLAYLAELLTRTGNSDRAAGILERLAALELTDDERRAHADDLANADELRARRS